MKQLHLLMAAILALLFGGGSAAWAQTWTPSEVGAGTYYLYNVGTGKWLCGGNAWGTQASVGDHATLQVTLALSDGSYTISTAPYYRNSYLGANGYVDNGTATAYTFNEVDAGKHIYTIANGSSLLTTSEGSTVAAWSGGDASDAKAQWQLVTKDALVANLANATAENPVDATFYLADQNFSRKDNSNNGRCDWTGAVSLGGDNSNWCAERFNTTADVYQNVTGMLNGKYAMYIQGFYRPGNNPKDDPDTYTNYLSGNIVNNAYYYANDAQANFMSIFADIDKDGISGNSYTVDGATITVPNSMNQASNCFTAGLYDNGPLEFSVTSGSLKTGVKKDVVIASDWTIFDNVRIYYLGPLTDLTAYAEALAAAVANAQAITQDIVPAAVYSNLQDVVTANNKEWSTADDYTAATAAITTATAQAQAFVADYAEFLRVHNGAKAMETASTGDDAKATLDGALGEQKAIVDACTADSTFAATVDSAKAAMRTAATAYVAAATLNDGSAYDLTFYFNNPTPTANGDGWTVSEGATYDTGNNNAEFWQRSGASLSQTLPQLPAGSYTLTAVAFTRTGMTATLAAGANSMSIATVGSDESQGGVNGRGTANTWLNNGNGVNNLDFSIETPQDVTVSLTADNATGDHWLVWRSFTLAYTNKAVDLSPYQTALAQAVAAAAAITQDMVPAAVYSNLQDVVAANNKAWTTPDDYTAATAAITTATAQAQAFVADYAEFLRVHNGAKAMETASTGDDAKATLDGVLGKQKATVDACTADSTFAATVDSAKAAMRTAATAYVAAATLNDGSAYDLTFYLNNPTPTANADGWTINRGQRSSLWASTTYDTENNCAEFWQRSGASLSQTLPQLPTGSYTLTAVAFTRTGMTATLAAGDYSMSIATVDNGEVNTRAQANTWFNNGNGVNNLNFGIDTPQDVTISLTADNTSNDHWLVWRSFTLAYTSKAVDFSLYQAALAQAIADAAVITQDTVTDAAYYNLQATIAANNKAWTTVADYKAAIQAINDAVDDAKVVAGYYSDYKRVRDAVKALEDQNVYTDEDGMAKRTFDDAVAETDAMVEETAITSEDFEAAKAEVRNHGGSFFSSVTVTDEAGFDLTDAYITNATPTANADGWTVSERPNQFDAANNNAEFWNQSGASLSQTLPQLPAGTYTLTAVALTRTDMTATLAAADYSMSIATVGSDEVNNRAQANTWFNNGNGVNALDFAINDDWKAVTVSLTADSTTSDHWTVWRSFRLTFNGPKATDGEVAALNTASNAVEEKLNTLTLGFDAGDYAPYNNADILKAAAAAKALNTSVASSLKVRGLTTRLGNATWVANTEEVNAVNDGSLSTVPLTTVSGGANAAMQALGWTANGNFRWIHNGTETDDEGNVQYPSAAQCESGQFVFVWPSTNPGFKYGEQTGYTMPLKANTRYQVTFKFGGWENPVGDFGVSVLDANGDGLPLTSVGGAGAFIGAEDAMVSVRKVFTTGEAGNYVLTLTSNGNATFSDVSIIRAVADEVILDDKATAAPAANEFADVTYDRTLYSGWNTIVLPFATTLRELGAQKAYALTGSTENANVPGNYTINLTTVESGELEANTPYIINMAAEKTGLSFDGKAVAPDGDLSVDGGNGFTLQGTYVAYEKGSSPIQKDDYIVVGQGFANAKGGNELHAFRAWLRNSGTGEAKAFTIDGEEVTGIRAIALESALTGKAYNLQGQRVEKPRHGVFIIDGRKVVVK